MTTEVIYGVRHVNGVCINGGEARNNLYVQIYACCVCIAY